MPILADYVWLSPGLNNVHNIFRWKTRVFHNENELGDLLYPTFPDWDFDGSSTNQSVDNNTEIVLKPAFVCSDPFRPTKGFIVLCDVFYTNGEPVRNWNRQTALNIFNIKPEKQPWFGIEQEYFLVDPRLNAPLGFMDNKNIPAQGLYYCRLGYHKGRYIAEKHLEMCINAGLTISGMNAEVGPSQWEYQIGPCIGINAADQLMVSRYILERIADMERIMVVWNPKPIEGDWNGSGCHVNYSTAEMRGEVESVNGLDEIMSTINKLKLGHEEMILTYSNDNIRRLSGNHETSKYDEFTYGIGTRNTSIRVSNKVEREQKGYLEDRRPGSDMDPYVTTSLIYKYDTI